MGFNPWSAIQAATGNKAFKGISSIADIAKMIKANKTPQPSNSLQMLPDGTMPGGQATAGASSVPVATDHTHGGGNSSKGDRITPRPDPATFMGKGQVDKFSSLTDPGSVGRDGKTITAADTPKPLTGQAPVLGTDYDRITPREEPVDIDSVGINSLYNS